MRFNDLVLENHRAFYGTLVSFCTVFVNLFYYFVYNTSPLTMVSLIPIIFWITYDSNEHERATVEGYWIWVGLLIASTLFSLAYPLF